MGELLLWPLLIAGGYLLGGVMFSYYIPRMVRGVDICGVSDDGNPGAANVFLQCGTGMGLLCVALDILKGFLPVVAAFRLLNSDRLLFAAVMAAPVLGHASAPLQDIRGGKCIATAFGVLIATIPHSRICWILAGLYIFFSTIIRPKPMAKRSLLVFTLFAVAACFVSAYERTYSLGIGSVLISCIVIAKHVMNVIDTSQNYGGDKDYDKQIDEGASTGAWSVQGTEHD